MIQEKIALKFLNRTKKFFSHDYKRNELKIKNRIKNSRIVVIGGAGSIGFSVVKLLLNYNPKLIHIVDINENKLVEVIRYIRSSIGYIDGKIETFPLDVGSKNFEILVNKNKGYDIWLNFSAMKHVRSERDPLILMRMIEVNFENTLKMLKLAKKTKAKRFFSVSTDKACDPINFLGATKRLMEFALSLYSKDMITSSARFGNVAFSDGSLLYGALQRLNNNQPLVAPVDIKRYFLTHEEASRLSLIAACCTKTGEILVPQINKSVAQRDFPSILKNLLHSKGYEMFLSKTEHEARILAKKTKKKKWPCFIFSSDTTGEKKEEFFIGKEDILKKSNYSEIEIINTNNIIKKDIIKNLLNQLKEIKNKQWDQKKIKKLMLNQIKNFTHKDLSKSLEEKM
tara:strand:- start:7532 stop:8725 length:1194 start_codon:yes stop_codon:yes gene_type:complete